VRTALEIAMAGPTCGPGITVQATREAEFSASIASMVFSGSGSTFPSTIIYSCLFSSAAPRDKTDSGNRTLRGDVIHGLTKITFGLFTMTPEMIQYCVTSVRKLSYITANLAYIYL